jgi:hypothetical protein
VPQWYQYTKKEVREAGNYRPVYLTSIPCKVLESVIKDRMMEHLISNNLIKDTQHGLMPGRSCTTNFVSFLESITEAKDSGKSVEVIYLDFSKTFDKVPHKRLMAKLRAKGINEEILRWMEHWLSDRKQTGWRTVGRRRSWIRIARRTVLGQCLFLVFIDDPDNCTVGSTNIKFADDTKCWKVVENDGDRAELQETLDKLIEWADL